ncbi:hypothetical protein R9X47_08715 [Wukongibacter baidiensis]
MIFGMPASDFWTFAIWPILWTVLSIYLYFRMAIADAREEKMEVDN